ncbi:MAG: TfoX/Sxy family protein [Rhodospirillales bacterium]
MAKAPPPRLQSWLASLAMLEPTEGPISARRLFGGWGIFCDRGMFALVSDEELYFKADERNRETFSAAGSAPFTYMGKGRPKTLSYWRCPDPGPDDPETLLHYAGLGIAAAGRAAASKRPKSGGSLGRIRERE